MYPRCLVAIAFALIALQPACDREGSEQADRPPGATEPDLSPRLLHDETEIGDYVRSFPVDSYQVATVPGIGRFYVEKEPLPDVVKDVIRNGQPWEESIVDLLGRLLGPGDTVLDIGAHIGTIALPMSRHIGQNGHCYAFEPQRKVFRELSANLALNGIRNVSPLRYALGDTIGIAEMEPAPEGNEGGARVGRGGDQVELRPLDSFGFRNLSLVKIDVEGFEDYVLDGARETLLNSGLPTVLIEIQGGVNYFAGTPEMRARNDATCARLERLGYGVRWLDRFDYVATRPRSCVLPVRIGLGLQDEGEPYLAGYWAHAQPEGRWLFDDCPAGVVVHIPEASRGRPLEVRYYAMYVPAQEKSYREIDVHVNGVFTQRWRYAQNVSPVKQQSHPRIVVSAELTRQSPLRVTFYTRDDLDGSVLKPKVGLQAVELVAEQ